MVPTCSISIATNVHYRSISKAQPVKEIFMRLVKGSDVVVEDFRPDVKELMGIAYRSTQGR